MPARGRSKRTAPSGATKGGMQCLAKSLAVNSWPRPPPAPPRRRSNSRRLPIAQAAPFKLGLLTVKTGPLAQGGIQMEQGVLTWLKEHNNKIAGRKIEFFSADTGGNPAGTKTKAQELVERDKVDVILGPLAAFELLAITDYIREHKMPTAQPRRRRRSDAAPAQSLFPARLGDLLAGDASDGPLRGEGDEAQDASSASPKTSPSATSRWAASRRPSRRMAAASPTSCGRHWSRRTTRPIVAQISDCDGVCQGFAGSNPLRFMKAMPAPA